MITIDGKDIYSNWNMAVLDGSYDSLFKYPKRKPVKYTNFAEEDGIHPDLTEFETESRRVELKFCIKHNTEAEFRALHDNFFSEINKTDYVSFDFGFGIVYKFRYAKNESLKSMNLYKTEGGTIFTIEFIEDAPSINKSVVFPVGGVDLRDMYVADGRDFADFGIHPDGEVGDVLKFPEVKDPFYDGKEYNLDVRRIKHKEVTQKFWMICNSKEEFVTNYQAFYNHIAKPGYLDMYIREINATVEAYYMECPNFKIETWGDMVAARLSIKYCIPQVTWGTGGTTAYYKVMQDLLFGLLADENGRVIVINR